MKKLLLFILCSAANLSGFAQPCAPNTNSLLFNGTSAYVSVANQTGFNITDSITIEAWVNASAFGITSAQNSIVCKHGWSQGEAGYVMRLGGSGQLSFNFAGLDINGVPVSWVDNVSPTGSLTTATWYHVAGTFDGNNSKIYINGVLKGTTPFTGTIVTSPGYPLNIGHLSDPGQPADRYFNGYMDEVRIWHRALTQVQIQANMNTQLDTSVAQVGLVSYWRMNNGTGTNVTDLEGSGAGVTNGATWSATVPFNSAPPTPAIVYSLGTLVSNSATNNQWCLNGVPILGATNQTYVPTVNGAYTVIVTNAAGCSATSNPYNITTLSIQDLNSLFAINAYATNGFITFDMETATAQQNVSIRICDITGKTVQQLTGKNLQAGKNKVVINSYVSKGIYLYEVSGSRMPVTKGKFVFN